MPFRVAVVFFSQHGLLVVAANIIAEGARKVSFSDLSSLNPSRLSKLHALTPLAV